jgi:hypothetical protein
MKNGFAVMAERCNECLFGPNKIVSNKRRADIIRGITRDDSYFICHKATMQGTKAACRSDWDQRACGQLGRIMGRLGAVQFVTEADLADLPKERTEEDDE